MPDAVQISSLSILGSDQSDYCQVMSPASSPYELTHTDFQPKISPSDEAGGISRQIIKVLLESPGSCCDGPAPSDQAG